MNEQLVQAYMRVKNIKAPCVIKEDDGRLTPLGEHDAAIIEACKRLGIETIQGVYVIRCNDKIKRKSLAEEMDAKCEEILKGNGLAEGHHRWN